MDYIRYKAVIILLLISLTALLGFKKSELLIYEDMNIDGHIESYAKLHLGISKVNKTLEGQNCYYTLIKGEKVLIKDCIEGECIIIDEDDNEFIVDSNLIEKIETMDNATRGTVSRRTNSITKIVKTAYDELGKPYVYGDTGKKGYDCSGLVYSIYSKELGIELPRTSYSLADVGSEINRSELVPGDILLFNTTGKRISHAGIYIGEGNMIHASSGERKVIISSIDSGYFNSRYVTARRIVE